MSTKVQAHIEREMLLRADQVYHAWLDPSKVRKWMTEALKAGGLPGDVQDVEINPRVGGNFLFTDTRKEGLARHWGTYLELYAATRIVFTWITEDSEGADPSVVTIAIQAQQHGCLATMTHTMDSAWTDYIPKGEKSWFNMLAAIDNS